MSYSNAGFGLDYSLGKPYGGRWLSKPYGRKFLRPRRPSYAPYGDEALDLSLPLSYGPPPHPTPAPYGSSSLAAMPSTMNSYRNPSPFAPSFASYGLGNSLPPYAAASALMPDLDEAPPLYTGTTYSLTPPKNYKGTTSSNNNNKGPKESPVPVASESPSTSSEDDPSSSSSYKFAASRLIPRIVKAPFKKIYKAFSSRKHRAFSLG